METKTFPVEGIKQVTIERLAPDARLRGDGEASVLQVTFQPIGRETADFAVDGETLRFQGGLAVRVTLPPQLGLTIGEAGGELRAQDMHGTVTVQSVGGDLRLKSLRGTVQIGEVAGGLRADEVANLQVLRHCAGDLRAQAVDDLFVASVAGDARLYQVGAARLGAVRGDLRAEKLAGGFGVASAAGDVRLAEVGGPVSVQEVTGDFRGHALAGGLAAQSIRGDAYLSGPYGAEAEYSLAAGGDVTLYVPLAANLRLTVQAGGRIRSDLQLTPQPDGSTTYSCNCGPGHAVARLSVKAGGDLRILQADAAETAEPGAAADRGSRSGAGDSSWHELHDLGEHIRQQVHASLAAAGIETRQFPFGPEAGGQGRSARAHRAGRAGSGEHAAASDRSQTTSRPGGASEAEQAAILKMLEDGTITADEAEALFRALGG